MSFASRPKEMVANLPFDARNPAEGIEENEFESPQKSNVFASSDFLYLYPFYCSEKNPINFH